MPTKKRRVGFIPRSEVLNLINKLSFENNLSSSKIINILVEEALYKRGMYSIKTGKVLDHSDSLRNSNENRTKINNFKKFYSNECNNNLKNYNADYINEENEDLIDMEIYTKFLMFLQFQERMRGEI